MASSWKGHVRSLSSLTWGAFPDVVVFRAAGRPAVHALVVVKPSNLVKEVLGRDVSPGHHAVVVLLCAVEVPGCRSSDSAAYFRHGVALVDVSPVIGLGKGACPGVDPPKDLLNVLARHGDDGVVRSPVGDGVVRADGGASVVYALDEPGDWSVRLVHDASTTPRPRVWVYCGSVLARCVSNILTTYSLASLFSIYVGSALDDLRGLPVLVPRSSHGRNPSQEDVSDWAHVVFSVRGGKR